MANKNAITKISKIILVGQLFFVIIVFGFAIFFIPNLEYPKNGEYLEDGNVEFKFSNAHVILVDNNKDFSSPRKINFEETNVTKISFKSGTYYWKAIGFFESFSRKFTIKSNVALELNKENKTIQNVGDSILNVSVENDSGISGLVILDINVEYPVDVDKEIIYRGEEYGK